MLKRPRAPSPSPTRPDPSSPPPLDNTAHLPLRIIKRRRTAGPVLDSHERRDYEWNSDDGEDDYEEEHDMEDAGGETSSGAHDKTYELVNHVLHGLHTEHQHRSRRQSTHPQSQWRTHNLHAYRDRQSPASSPVKDGQVGHSSFAAPYRELVESQETEDDADSDRFQDMELHSLPHKGPSPSMQNDERLCVTHRYEDTNRLLGSLVLSRRRTLGTPPLGIE